MLFLSFILLAMSLTIVLIPIFRDLAVRFKALDQPGERKINVTVVPRCGGIAMALGALFPILIWVPLNEFVCALMIGAGIIVFFGIMDDIKELNCYVKFAAQCLAATVVTFYGGVNIDHIGSLLPTYIHLPGIVSILLTLVVIVGVTNAINLSDGLDGLAGGISLLSFSCIGYFAWHTEHFVVLFISAAMIGVIFGFLRFNTYPARLFMGDAGSQLLGFVLISLSLKLTQNNSGLSPLLPLLILAFPVLDTLTVMLTRIYKRKSPFAADKNHFHHRLMDLGFYHTESVLIIYLFHVAFLAFSFVYQSHNEWVILSVYLVCSGIILAAFFSARQTGWKFKRNEIVDKVIKGRLKKLKESNIMIKISFKTVEIGIPLLLLFISILPETYPVHFTVGSVIILALITATWFACRKWIFSMLGFALYLFTPFLIYFGETNRASWCHSGVLVIYNLSFAILAAGVILTLKLTRRTRGFKSSPIDFLILLFAIVIPNLPDELIKNLGMNFILVKVIVCYFGFEVIIGELRIRSIVNVPKVLVSALPVVLIICLKSFV